MKEIYKGFEIEYIENAEKFEATIGESSYKNTSLQKVKEYIDRLLKKKYKRTPVIVKKWDGIEKGILTSETDERGCRYCWINWDGKESDWRKREKVDIDNVYEDSEVNNEIVSQISKKKKQIEELKILIKEEGEKLIPYKSQIKTEQK